PGEHPDGGAQRLVRRDGDPATGRRRRRADAWGKRPAADRAAPPTGLEPLRRGRRGAQGQRPRDVPGRGGSGQGRNQAGGAAGGEERDGLAVALTFGDTERVALAEPVRVSCDGVRSAA